MLERIILSGKVDNWEIRGIGRKNVMNENVREKKPKYRLTAKKVVGIGFAILILSGAVLLSTPLATRTGGIPFVDALFTSASASCVTGLVVFDTYSQFTLFGQIIILILIQIGGLGFMMVAILFSMLVGRRIGLRERSLLMESVSALNIGGIVRLTKRALTVTAFFEGLGAIILSTRFIPMFGVVKGIWFSIFHSISAFCNAGFDLMGIHQPGSSLTEFVGDPVVSITVPVLIMCGGLGFFLWNDIVEKGFHFRKYRLHTKIMISATFILVTGGTILFFILEYNHAFAGLSIGEKIIAAFFQSVTPRTAGFNTVDLTKLSGGGNILTVVLMIIGAGSGSTGGGLKVTTCAVLFLHMTSYVKGYEGIDIFGRRVEGEATSKAAANVASYLLVGVAGCLIIAASGFTAQESAFEAFSALGTVGLTLGITSSLPLIPQLVVTFMMYFGRVGSMTVAMAVTEGRVKEHLGNIKENIIVG